MLKLFLMILFNTFICTKEITLEEAIDLALSKNLEVKQKELEKDISKQDRWNNYTNFLPSLRYEGRYLNEKREFTNSFLFKHNLTFNVSDILYNFNTVNKYNIAVEIKRNELRGSKLILKAKVIDIFIKLLKIERELKISKIYLDKSLKDLELYSNLYKNNNSSEYEIIELEAIISQLKSRAFELEITKEELQNNFVLFTGEKEFSLVPLNLKNIDRDCLNVAESDIVGNSIVIKNFNLEYKRYQHPFTSLLPKIDFSLIYRVETDNDFFKNWEQEIKKFSFNFTVDLFKWGQSVYDFKIKEKTLNLEIEKVEEEKLKLQNNLKNRKSFLVKALELLNFKKNFLNKLKNKSLVMKERVKNGFSSLDDSFEVDKQSYDQEIEILDLEYNIFEKIEELKLIVEGVKL